MLELLRERHFLELDLVHATVGRPKQGRTCGNKKCTLHVRSPKSSMVSIVVCGLDDAGILMVMGRVAAG